MTMKPSAPGDRLAFLAGGGEMGERIRTFDWSTTAIGAIEGWSPALRMQVSFLLANRFPMLLWWGPTFCSVYNDAYAPILGAKHPWALGRPVSECWSEIWDVLKPLIETPFGGGPPTWIEDFLLEIRRHGYLEEGHFTVAYSPVPDETAPRGIGGVVATVHEISGKVIAERRVAALRDLGSRAGEAKNAEQACAIAAATLAVHAKDLPFVLLYLIDAERRTARLAGAAGVTPGDDVSPLSVALDEADGGGWPLAEASRGEAMVVVEGLAERFDAVPRGPWSDAPHTAVVVPIPSTRAHEPAGLLVAGVSARLQLDAHYRDFFELLRSQLATFVANARAYEEEKKRAEALAEIDRAKTTFFSNVSHEFRTPLTLMLGPVEDLLARSHRELSPAAAGQLEVVSRNGVRLLRLVNTLLDFSRIEAGRVRASYQPTDLAAFSAELASVFRAAIERAGLRLRVDCPRLDEPVFVDRDMWEKIVLNLLSNAFKFTFEGEISVSLRSDGGMAELRVRDTGTGIVAAEMPRLFERFHRIENARSRTHEGSGIGLALVQELVKLHGGTIEAQSALGEGTTFTVRLPLGSAHLPADQIGESRALASTATGAAPYVEEALRWLPGAEGNPEALAAELPTHYEALPVPAQRASHDEGGQPRVLVVDDNADMRQYIERLLAERYQVQALGDGEAALAAARQQPPDLVLTDVMMPRLDGFGLLRELRADPRTRDAPVILLSARAGEESRVEGMEAGADDYLIKPFSARELLARVGAHLQMARMRRQAADALREADRRKDEFLAMLAHELRGPLAPLSNMLEVMKRASGNQELMQQARVTMERQLGQLVRFVDDLLDVSRITRNKLVLRKERAELASVVQQAIETSRPLALASRHEVGLTLPAQPIYLDADPVRLAQVFTNLLSNACKYTEPGGRIQLSAETAGGDVVVKVSDTGLGIPAEQLASIFEMFTQVDRSLERAQGGLGIGLTLVKRLVELHGGTVQAFSEGPGRGSEFVVRLPVLLGQAMDERAVPAARREPAGARRVLIVDDNPDSLESLAMLLSISGNETRTAHDGLEALAAAEGFRPELVLLDIGLPKLNGFEAARRIREQPWGKEMVLVALTGWGQDAHRRQAKESGFDLHMVKPVALESLKELLASLPLGRSAD
jgi:signal transduction histidine kinase